MSHLRQAISVVAQEAHGAGTPFNDKPERVALRKFVRECVPFQKYWQQYFGMPPDCKIIDDPLGPNQVDLGIVGVAASATTNQIYGLIEVDVFNEWGETWPQRYKKFHVLRRKLKYFSGNSYPYITCTFNNSHAKMVTVQRQYIESCTEKYGVSKLWMEKIQSYDYVVRCPLQNPNVHWFHNR